MITTNYDWICENVHSTHKYKYIPRNTILKYSIHYISRMHEATCVQSPMNPVTYGSSVDQLFSGLNYPQF